MINPFFTKSSRSRFAVARLAPVISWYWVLVMRRCCIKMLRAFLCRSLRSSAPTNFSVSQSLQRVTTKRSAGYLSLKRYTDRSDQYWSSPPSICREENTNATPPFPEHFPVYQPVGTDNSQKMVSSPPEAGKSTLGFCLFIKRSTLSRRANWFQAMPLAFVI